MTKHRKSHAPPPATPAPGILDQVVKLAAVAVFIVGVITVAGPWFRGVDNSLPPPGWLCWSVTRSTSAGTKQSGHCEVAKGWHVEQWPGIGKVAVPDEVWVPQQYSLRD